MRVVVSLPRSGMYCKYLSVVEILLCPKTLDRTTKETPCFIWCATKVCLKSLTLASLISANLKYLSTAVLIFLIKNGLPDLVIKT